MPNFISQIVLFNQSILGIAQREQGLIPANEAQISIESIIEELQELREAFEQGDFIKCVDAIGDGLFFTIGVLYKFGMTEHSIYSLMAMDHKSEMGNTMYNLFEQVAELNEFVGLPKQEDLDAYIDGIEHFVNCFSLHCERMDSFNAVQVLALIANGFIGLFGDFGVNAKNAQLIMTAIFNANMTKKRGVNEKRGDGVAADAVKPTDFIPPEEEIKRILNLVI